MLRFGAKAHQPPPGPVVLRLKITTSPAATVHVALQIELRLLPHRGCSATTRERAEAHPFGGSPRLCPCGGVAPQGHHRRALHPFLHRAEFDLNRARPSRNPSPNPGSRAVFMRVGGDAILAVGVRYFVLAQLGDPLPRQSKETPGGNPELGKNKIANAYSKDRRRKEQGAAPMNAAREPRDRKDYEGPCANCRSNSARCRNG